MTLVSFDVALLFTQVLVTEAINKVEDMYHLEKQVVELASMQWVTIFTLVLCIRKHLSQISTNPAHWLVLLQNFHILRLVVRVQKAH